MKRGIAIAALLLAGCTHYFGGGDDEDGDDRPPPDAGSTGEIPAGVWEPMPGAEINDASVAANGDTLWWAAQRRISPSGDYLFDDSIWMTATTSRGTTLVPPSAVAPASDAKFAPDVALTPSAVVVKLGGVETLLRRYEHAGAPLGEPYALDVTDLAFNHSELIATAGGGLQFVAALISETAEAAVVDIDAAGVQQATRLVGVPDDSEVGGSNAGQVAAVGRPDGSTLLAWDRYYNYCVSSKPASTLTTTLTSTTFGPIQPVRDLPDSESLPVIAAKGDGAFIAWVTSSAAGSRVSLARYPDVTTVLAEVGGSTSGWWYTEAALALAAPDRGALVWSEAETGNLFVTPFEYRGQGIYLGDPHPIPDIDAGTRGSTVGFVHVGDDRYVVAWVESGSVATNGPNRLFAMQVDLATTTMRPAPPPSSDTSVRTQWLKCP